LEISEMLGDFTAQWSWAFKRLQEIEDHAEQNVLNADTNIKRIAEVSNNMCKAIRLMLVQVGVRYIVPRPVMRGVPGSSWKTKKNIVEHRAIRERRMVTSIGPGNGKCEQITRKLGKD
jgi:hypothetical protein